MHKMPETELNIGLQPAIKQITKVMHLRMLCRIGGGFAAFVIIIGAITRLTDSGLGCPDWPGCYGSHWIPNAQAANEFAPGTPLEPFKAGMEMFHRYIASALGLIVLAAVYYGWKIRALAPQTFRLTLWLLAAVCIQGAFGAWTVTWKLLPQVVTLHLLGGLTCLSLFLLTASSCSGVLENKPRFNAVSRLGLMALLVLALQISLGGWTSTNYAAIGCVGFPTCNGQWLPEMDFAAGFDITAPIGPDYLYGQLEPAARTAIHFSHRLGAIILGVFLLAYGWQQRTNSSRLSRLASNAACLIYGLQVGLGIILVTQGLPLSIAALHTAGAVLILVLLILSLSTSEASKKPSARAHALITDNKDHAFKTRGVI